MYRGFMESLFSFANAKALAAISLTIFLNIIGKNYLAYEILFILVIIDTLTGLAKGVKFENLSSRRFAAKGKTLLLYFSLVLASHQMVRYTPYMQWLEHFIVIFCASTEMISIIENAHQLGIPVPKWVVEKLEVYIKKPQ